MNCQNFEGIVNELARDRVLDQIVEADMRASALAHLDECTACALRLQEGRALTRCLDEMALDMKLVATPAWLEEQLRQAFRERIGTPVSSTAPAMNRSINQPGWNRWIVAAAAVLLIGLGIAGLRFRAGQRAQSVTGEPENPIAQIPSSMAGVETGMAILPAKPGQELAGSIKRKNLHRRPRHSFKIANDSGGQPTVAKTAARANDTESEVATQFMPLSYAGPINLQDGGQLVRVELPRSAMLSLGLPVNMDRYGERVKADVFLGADGLARAIRFVQ